MDPGYVATMLIFGMVVLHSTWLMISVCVSGWGTHALFQNVFYQLLPGHMGNLPWPKTSWPFGKITCFCTFSISNLSTIDDTAKYKKNVKARKWRVALNFGLSHLLVGAFQGLFDFLQQKKKKKVHWQLIGSNNVLICHHT